MKRFEERLQNYKNALKSLKEGLIESPSELEIDGILQRFEFPFELSWKCMKDYLENEGIISNLGSPREIINLAFKHNLINNGEAWINMMLDRNQLSHLYDNEASRSIYLKIKDKYFGLMVELLEMFEKLNREK